MKLENEFTVPASIDEAWAVLLDVPRSRRACPAPRSSPAGEEGEYKGQMKIKIGPITASYKGTVKIQEADEAAHSVAMRAQAKDARGQGTAAATITSTMEEVADGTKVHVVTDMRVTGPAAQFGRGVMQDVSAKLMKRFADCLAEQMQASPDVRRRPRSRRPPRPRRASRDRRRRPTAGPTRARRRSRTRACPAPPPASPAPRPSRSPERLVRHVVGARAARAHRRRARPRRGQPRRGAQARRPARRAASSRC